MAVDNLEKNQLVVFSDGRKVSRTGVAWSEKNQAWWVLAEDKDWNYITDDDGHYIRLFSNEVIEKPARKKRVFTPNRESCTVQIYPCGSTEKAYEIEDGWNGCWGRNSKTYYKYIAKSVCFVDELGRIFAPVWAVK